MSSGPSNAHLLVHQYGQTTTWCILLNIMIISASLRNLKIASLIHYSLGGIICFLTYFFILWLLIPFGFIQSQKEYILYYLHAIIGCAMLAFIAIQVTLGIFARFFQRSPGENLLKFKITKNIHQYFGYFLAVIFKINIIWNWYGVN
jgi:hypothetical protein